MCRSFAVSALLTPSWASAKRGAVDLVRRPGRCRGRGTFGGLAKTAFGRPIRRVKLDLGLARDLGNNATHA